MEEHADQAPPQGRAHSKPLSVQVTDSGGPSPLAPLPPDQQTLPVAPPEMGAAGSGVPSRLGLTAWSQRSWLSAARAEEVKEATPAAGAAGNPEGGDGGVRKRSAPKEARLQRVREAAPGGRAVGEDAGWEQEPRRALGVAAREAVKSGSFRLRAQGADLRPWRYPCPGRALPWGGGSTPTPQAPGARTEGTSRSPPPLQRPPRACKPPSCAAQRLSSRSHRRAAAPGRAPPSRR
ncbi:hypothetical protein VULLAG_LOCUS1081 [Vulpes lagopus]